MTTGSTTTARISPSTSNPEPQGRPMPGLSRERIADAVLALADREGVDAVTMRRLAAELGVGTMTLYGYFATKDELLDVAMDRAAQEVRIPPRRGSWKTQLRALAIEIHGAIQRHPSGLQLRARRPLLSPGGLRLTEAGMRILLEAGFSKRQAAQAWRLLFVYTFGSVTFTPAAVPAELRREWEVQLAGLPEDEFPSLTLASKEAVGTMSGSEPFHDGLHRILDGLEVRLGSGRSNLSGPATGRRGNPQQQGNVAD